MGVVRLCNAGVAAVLLALLCQKTMAQGLLPIEPHPFDSLQSPYPLGPLQKFGDLPSASGPRFFGIAAGLRAARARASCGWSSPGAAATEPGRRAAARVALVCTST
jgi:hypothetical protein